MKTRLSLEDEKSKSIISLYFSSYYLSSILGVSYMQHDEGRVFLRHFLVFTFYLYSYRISLYEKSAINNPYNLFNYFISFLFNVY